MKIDHKIHQALKINGITVDMLGQPLKVGDRVLVKGYSSPTHNLIAEIKKVNKVNLKVDVTKTQYQYSAYMDAVDNYKYNGSTGKEPNWRDYMISVTVPMNRDPYDVIKFEAQEKVAKEEFEKLMDEHPEAFV